MHACTRKALSLVNTLERGVPHTPDLHAAPDFHILAFVDKLNAHSTVFLHCQRHLQPDQHP
jgi:hypothetical protein